MNEASAPGLVVPDLTPMSTTPAVRRPYCAGSAPVSSDSELAKRGDRIWLNSASPSGNCTPSSRYCRLPWSPRTWTWPKPSCTTPGARSSTWLSGAFSPCGVFWMAVRLKSYLVAPRLGRIELRSSSILVAVTVMPGSVTGRLGRGLRLCRGRGHADEEAADRYHTTRVASFVSRRLSLEMLYYNIMERQPSDRHRRLRHGRLGRDDDDLPNGPVAGAISWMALRRGR